MSLHNHLHIKTRDEEEEQLSMYPFIAAIGLFGMVFTIVGNVKQTTEMYTHFLQCSECLYFHVPTSFYFTIFSDACLIIYGFFNNDFVIIVYGCLNSGFIFGSMLLMYRQERQHTHIRINSIHQDIMS